MNYNEKYTVRKMSIKYIKTNKMCLKPKKRTMKIGKVNKPSFKMFKPSELKMWAIMCVAILSNSIIPDGWKVTDVFREKNTKNQKKLQKTKQK